MSPSLGIKQKPLAAASSRPNYPDINVLRISLSSSLSSQSPRKEGGSIEELFKPKQHNSNDLRNYSNDLLRLGNGPRKSSRSERGSNTHRAGSRQDRDFLKVSQGSAEPINT